MVNFNTISVNNGNKVVLISDGQREYSLTDEQMIETFKFLEALTKGKTVTQPLTTNDNLVSNSQSASKGLSKIGYHIETLGKFAYISRGSDERVSKNDRKYYIDGGHLRVEKKYIIAQIKKLDGIVCQDIPKSNGGTFKGYGFTARSQKEAIAKCEKAIKLLPKSATAEEINKFLD